MKRYKLYVWIGFCPDWTNGLAFAIAKTEKTARKLIIKYHGYEPDCWGNLEIHELNQLFACSVCGGS